MINEINNSVLVDMVFSAAANLNNHRQQVDNMNVFPVPDGDTGTNMSMTINACIKDLDLLKKSDLENTSKALANAALRGARGNSGVILSQLVRGMQKALKGVVVINVETVAAICKSAADSAYRAVMKPTEGTILTVARMMAEFADDEYEKYNDVTGFLSDIVDAGNEALKTTPELLPQLKQANVVDSGGQGLMFLMEGALEFLKTGNITEFDKTNSIPETHQSKSAPADEKCDIKYKYCTECIVEKASEKADVFKFKSTVGMIGDSMVVVDDEEIVKLHIHTNHPDIVLGEALRLGELSSVKIENMKIQHSNLVKENEEKQSLDNENSVFQNEINKTQETGEKLPKQKYGFVSVAAGDGFCDIFTKLGVDSVISGGQTMNSSTDEILEAIENVNAENVFVFPNNKNIIMAAQQAQQLSEKTVFVIPTRNVTEAITCMINFDDELNPDELYDNMCDDIQYVKSAQTTYAVRDTVIDNNEIHTGDILGIVDGKIKFVDNDIEQSVQNCIADMVDDNTSVITLYYGEDADDKQAGQLCTELEDEYPDCDVSIQFGGQPVYHYIISVE